MYLILLFVSNIHLVAEGVGLARDEALLHLQLRQEEEGRGEEGGEDEADGRQTERLEGGSYVELTGGQNLKS